MVLDSFLGDSAMFFLPCGTLSSTFWKRGKGEKEKERVGERERERETEREVC